MKTRESADASGQSEDDVQRLANRLHLPNLRYREFGVERSDPADDPAPLTLPTEAVARPAPGRAGEDRPASAAAPERPAPPPSLAIPLSVVVSPPDMGGVLAFTFERLRQQVRVGRAPRLQLQLDLPRRSAAAPGAGLARSVSEVLASIAGPATPSVRARRAS